MQTLNQDDKTTIPFRESLKDSELEMLIQSSTLVRYARRDVIFKQGVRTSHIDIVKSGLVKIYKENKQGKYVILRLCKPGDFLGIISIFGGDVYQYSAAAVDDVEVLTVDIGVFYKVIKRNNTYALSVLREISQEGIFVYERLMNSLYKQLPGRIAEVLLYFSEVIYHDRQFELPFTRRELAEMAGTTKESFIRTLAEFKNDKIIEINGNKINIVSFDILKILSSVG